MEAIPDLKRKVQAAARVGERRWTLYLDNGVKIALPEQNMAAALERVAELDATQHILSKGIREIDLRTSDRLVIALAEAVDPKKVDAEAKLSTIQTR
jgi:cell division protein FtsQ